MPLRSRRVVLSCLLYSVLFIVLIAFMGIASAKQGATGKTAWEVKLAPNSRARSEITIRNQCKQTHSFSVVPTNVPYLQLPARPTVQVPGRTNQALGVVFDTAGMRPGDYRGSVAVKCDTCGEERGCSQENEILPVHLTVTAAIGIETPNTPGNYVTPKATPISEVSPTPTPSPSPRIGVVYGGPGPNIDLPAQIMGQKVNDKNCNGKIDLNEPGLAGWTITATNSGTGATVSTVTDANGFYFFNNLPAATYVISESPQTGWTQSLPGGAGTYVVPLAAGQVIQKDFGNCKNDDKECATIVPREAVCKTNDSGGYTYTFSVINNSGKDVTQILLTPTPGSSFIPSPQVFMFPGPSLLTPLPNGQSTTITVELGTVKPGTEPCFFVTLMTKDGPCCTVKVCPVLPDCCAAATGKFECNPRGGYAGTFTIINTSPNTIKNIYLYPPPGVTMSQTYFAVTLAPGQSFTTPVITIKGARPGRHCFRVSMHTEDMKDCCSVEVCIVLPECGIPNPY